MDVLAALREHDARDCDKLIRQQQTAKGAGEPFNLRTFKEHVQVLGPLVSALQPTPETHRQRRAGPTRHVLGRALRRTTGVQKPSRPLSRAKDVC